MIKRKEYETALLQLFTTVKSLGKLNEVQEICVEKFSYPLALSYMNGVQRITEASDRELFILYKSIETVISHDASRKFRFMDCFSDAEKTGYNQKFVDTEITDIYPIIFDVFNVRADQWVSVISCKRLYEMYQARAIRYNLNTQRPAKYSMTKNGVREYTINVNKKAVAEIKQQLLDGTYISNDITLNLNTDNLEIEWDYNNKQIIVTKGVMDIIDGYHRFKAVLEVMEEKPDFEFNFILNIMGFDTNKACNYIGQQDKRNPISKKFTKSLDATKPAYVMVHKLNEDATSPLYGCIEKDNANTIDYTRFFTFVNEAFKEVKTRQETQQAYKMLKQAFNIAIENEYISVDNHIPTYRELAVAVWCSAYCYFNKKDIKCLNKKINNAYNNLDDLEENRLDRGQTTKASVELITRFIEQQ